MCKFDQLRRFLDKEFLSPSKDLPSNLEKTLTVPLQCSKKVTHLLDRSPRKESAREMFVCTRMGKPCSTNSIRKNSMAFQPFLPLTHKEPQRHARQPRTVCATRPRRNRPYPRRSSARNVPNPVQTHQSLTSAERLQKVLSHMGVASRRAAEEMILSQRVRVNGRTISTLGTLVNPYTDAVSVDGKKVELPRLSWLAIHKPRGVLSVVLAGKRSISNYVPKSRRQGMVAVAPIEEDSSGLVILTNDRTCAVQLSRPGNGFVKEWIVDCEGVVPWTAVDRFRKGVELAEDEGGSVVSADVQFIGSGPVELGQHGTKVLTRFEVRLRDNRRHVVRRMFEAVGHSVFRASRKSFGPVLLGSLKRGDCRYLIPKEIKALKRGVSGKTKRE